MKKMEYIDPSFDIKNNPCFNSIDGLKDISDYLDFAISSTIHKQIPNVTEQREKELAAIVLKNFMFGDTKAFTSQYNIRENIRTIGYENIKYLLIKTLIEQDEINNRILHKLSPENYYDECIEYVTNISYSGYLSENDEWIRNNIPFFIDIYVSQVYGKETQKKEEREMICYGNPKNEKALEQLNLYMALNNIQK